MNKKFFHFVKLTLLNAFLFLIIFLSGCNPEQKTVESIEPTHATISTLVEPEATDIIPIPKEVDETPTVEALATDELMDNYAGIDPTGQVVTFWHTFPGKRETTLINIINEFNSNNAWGILVDPSYQGGNEDIKNRMVSFMNTSQSPSLLIATETQASTYQLGDALIDINHLVNHPNWGLAEMDILDFYPGLFEQGIFPSFNNSRLTYPLYGQMNVLYYNLDWLAELGYTNIPTTPESFLEAACSATGQPFSGSTATGRMGVHLQISPGSFSDWSLAFGGILFDHGSNQYNFESANINEAMFFLQSLIERGCGFTESNSTAEYMVEEIKKDFSRGVVLFTIDSIEKIPEFRSSIQEEANFNWQISALPHTTTNPAPNLQVTSASIPKTTPKEELAAWLFLKFFSSPEIQAKWIRETNVLPIRGSTVDLLGAYYSESPAAQMTLDLLNYSSQEPNVPGYDQIQTLSLETLYAILNEADINTTLSELSEKANLILKEEIALIPESPDPWAEIDPNGQSITFWHQQDQERSLILAEIINEFNATNKWGITVMPVVHQSYGEIFQKLLPVLNTEDVPNLVLAYQHQAAAYQEASGLVTLESLLDSTLWGLRNQDQKDFFQPIFEQDRYKFFEGSRLGFPIQRSTDILYYNVDLLNELGYQAPPKTPDEFREMACAASAFTLPSGESGSGYQFYLDATRFSSWVFAFGGEIFDQERNQFLLNGTVPTSTISFLRNLIDSGCASTAIDRAINQTAFSEGSLLFMIDSSLHLPTIANLVDNAGDFHWAVASIPSVSENPVQNIFGASLSIPTSTPEKELAAWLFIKYFSEPQIQAKWGQEAGYLPVRGSAGNFLVDFFKTSPNYQIAFNLLPYGKTEPSLPGYDFVHQEMELALQSIFLADGEEEEEIDLSGILDSLNATANQILLIHLER